MKTTKRYFISLCIALLIPIAAHGSALTDPTCEVSATVIEHVGSDNQATNAVIIKGAQNLYSDMDGCKFIAAGNVYIPANGLPGQLNQGDEFTAQLARGSVMTPNGISKSFFRWDNIVIHTSEEQLSSRTSFTTETQPEATVKQDQQISSETPATTDTRDGTMPITIAITIVVIAGTLLALRLQKM